MSLQAFPYHWHHYEEYGATKLRIFCLSGKNESIYIEIDDFLPYIYIELPTDKTWSPASLSVVQTKLKEMSFNSIVKMEFVSKKKLYFAKKDKTEAGEYVDKTYPFLKCFFKTTTNIRTFSYKLRQPIFFSGSKITLKVHESDANPVLQFMCMMDIKPASWFAFKGKKRESEDERESLCHHEFLCSYRHFAPIDNKGKVPARPYILSFDIEVNSNNPNVFPQSSQPEDKVFQISCVFARNGDPEEKFEKYILTLCKNKKGEIVDLNMDKLGEGIEVLGYETEGQLLEGFKDLVLEKNPQIICGYNIFSFDILYLYERSKVCNIERQFTQFSCMRGVPCKMKEISWSSSAFKNQEFKYLDAHGRLWIDLLPIIQRDYKLENYKLKTVSDQFLAASKDPLTPKGIFKCYRMFTPDSLALVGKYCVQDSNLVLKLFEKLQIWIGLCEMSNTCNTPMFTLFTQGQQIKIFSQVYKKCMADNIVIDKDSFVTNESDRFTGAYVFPPVPGLYEMVVSFDFSSLYPSTIISNNIDYSTLVLDPSIPDEKCHVIEWEEHINCTCPGAEIKTTKKEVVCDKQRHRFMKEPMGVLPTLLKNLLDARKRTNAEMKQMTIELEDMKDKGSAEYDDKKRMITVLDKRQLSYKVSANSVAPNTPIPCIDADGTFMYLTMEEISDSLWISDDDSNEVSKPRKGLSVWTEKGFTPIKYVIRHPIRTPLKRVLTHTGCVDVTEEHSLLDENAKEVRTIDVSIGDKLLHATLPLPSDTPKTPLFDTINNETIDTFQLKNINDEQAFLWGLFFAEGTCGVWGVLEKAKSSWIIYNNNYNLLERVKLLAEKCEGLNMVISPFYETAGVFHLKPVNNKEGSIVLLCNKYRKLFYDARGTKRIPSEIFSADLHTRQSFFMGYYAGDGSRLLKKGVVITNKGEIGSAGLCYLAKSLGYIVSISLSPGKDSIYRLQCCTSFRNKNHTSIKTITDSTPVPEIKKLQPDIIRNQTKIFFNKEGYVYYRGVKIICERIPRQKLLDAIDRLVDVMKERQSSIIEYYTNTKKIKYRKWCCQKESLTGIKGITLDNKTYVKICDCCEASDDGYNVLYEYTEKESVEYIYDIETENHHFAAGVGDLIVHNSMYGGMGTRKGYLPFLYGATCTTAKGRQSIEKASKFLVENYGAKLIYGDTDSCYINFSEYADKTKAKDLDSFCRQVESEISSLFPKPMKFAYEEQIYWRYLILTKKRYMALKCDLDGNVDNKIAKRGVLLSRRDNSKYIRDTYANTILKSFYREDLDVVLWKLFEDVKKLCVNALPIKDLVVTKGIGAIADYKIRPLHIDDKKCKKRLQELGLYHEEANMDVLRNIITAFGRKEDIEDESYLHNLEYLIFKEYVKLSLPAQIQLAERMRARGSHVSAGERLGYVITQNGDKLGEKMEDTDYFKEHAESLKIDYLYYMKLMINPFDEVLETVYGEKDLFKKFYKTREQFKKVIDQLQKLFMPRLRFVE